MTAILIFVVLGFSQKSFSYNYLLLPFGSDGAVFRTALVSDPTSDFSVYYNPSFKFHSKLATFASSYLVGSSYGGILFSPAKDITAGVLFFSDGGQDEVNYEGIKIGTYSSTYLSLFASTPLPYTHRIGERVLVSGVTGKLLYQSIADRKSLAVAIDGGIYLPFNSRVKIGASVRNIGIEIKHFYEKNYFPPPVISIGGFVKLSEKLVFLLAGGLELNYGFIFDAGIRLSPVRMFQISAGYSLKGRELNTGANLDILNGLAGGFIFKVKDLKVSYSIMPMGELGLTHYVGIVYR